jgi:hypothetical protein
MEWLQPNTTPADVRVARRTGTLPSLWLLSLKNTRRGRMNHPSGNPPSHEPALPLVQPVG